jgi:glycosyltransferase involved in cell wall biosynthesis
MENPPTQTECQTNRSVSVVIPARNAADTIGAQLNALMDQEYDGALEVIVVVNASTDGTADVVERFSTGRWPVRAVHEAVAGVNRARNAGVAAASGELILLCDADDVVGPGWVQELASVLKVADLVGGLVDAATLNSREVREMWDMEPLVRPRHQYIGFDSPWGCNCGFRRAAWQSVGGFDSELSGAMDEVEFFVRAQVAGFRLQFSELAVIQYRLRDDRRSARRRQYQNGLVGATLKARYRGMAPRVKIWRSAPIAWIWLLVQAPRACVDRNFRWRWTGTAERRVGQFVGWKKSRTVR